jgi:dienelactone hydrolase
MVWGWSYPLRGGSLAVRTEASLRAAGVLPRSGSTRARLAFPGRTVEDGAVPMHLVQANNRFVKPCHPPIVPCRTDTRCASIRRGLISVFSFLVAGLVAQSYGEADRESPGDEMIQRYLQQETAVVEVEFPGAMRSLEDWEVARPALLEQYHDMLGLWPLPEKTPLRATVTGTLERGEYVVENLHYQSRPGLYVTANLYRPALIPPGTRLPAVLYVCGHSPRGRDGNKTAYQSHGIWFARHGYVCLVLDTLQMGEIAGIHHGTYRENRWWWLSRGYTPAGVEAWNGVRGIDYLVSRPDVDPERIGVTGISGGGAATFWIAAADERARVVVPVSGMADLESYVSNRVINGHCDCMFLYNTHQWPWTRIAALVAPRPMLFVNSDRDPIFPMDANERVINRLERVYSWYGAGDLVDSFVSIGGHAYRQDIRQGVYRFMQIHLQNDPRPVTNSERDLVSGTQEQDHPIPPAALRVFPLDTDIPPDALNAIIDREFVPLANTAVPPAGEFAGWKAGLLDRLRKLSFNHFPDRIPAAALTEDEEPGWMLAATEPGINVRVRLARQPTEPVGRILLYVTATDASHPAPAWIEAQLGIGDVLYIGEPRGVGGTRWTRRNPPNYVERSHFLLGRTVDSGRVWDIAAVARALRQRYEGKVPVVAAGQGATSVLAAYAGLLEPDIAEFVLHDPPASHMDDAAPVLLNVLRVCDIPEAIGMLAPRRVTLEGRSPDLIANVAEMYGAAGAGDRLATERLEPSEED